MAKGTNTELQQGLAAVMETESITDLQRLSGGASRETWRFKAGNSDYVLQRVRAGTVGGNAAILTPDIPQRRGRCGIAWRSRSGNISPVLLPLVTEVFAGSRY